MLFQELVEQHCVHRFVADGVWFSLLVTVHQIGVDLFHVLGNEAELRDALRVKIVFVAKGDRLKRENRFARLVHRFNRFLETNGGDDRAEMAVTANYYSYASGNGAPRNSRDKGGRLRPDPADAD